jgi:putative ABC transport system substrate-binding protein
VDRRRFVLTSLAGAVAAPLGAGAQPGRKLARVGVLGATSADLSPPMLALRVGFRELGYQEGRDVAIEWRWAHGQVERFPALAAELASLQVDVIVASVNAAVVAARTMSPGTPIVMVYATDPVGEGFVANLGRPGSNITGVTIQATGLVAKGLQLLKEALPDVSRMAVLRDASDPGRQDERAAIETTARSLRVQLQVIEARALSEVDGIFTAMVRGRVGGVVVESTPMTFANRTRIAELAIHHRLPSVSLAREHAEAGTLMSYGPDYPDLARRAAYFVDKILKGARPGDLPVEQPLKFELVVNRRTARTLGRRIPAALLARADRVIE